MEINTHNRLLSGQWHLAARYVSAASLPSLRKPPNATAASSFSSCNIKRHYNMKQTIIVLKVVLTLFSLQFTNSITNLSCYLILFILNSIIPFANELNHGMPQVIVNK